MDGMKRAVLIKEITDSLMKKSNIKSDIAEEMARHWVMMA